MCSRLLESSLEANCDGQPGRMTKSLIGLELPLRPKIYKLNYLQALVYTKHSYIVKNYNQQFHFNYFNVLIAAINQQTTIFLHGHA